jgi:hypothetical protein
MSENGIEAQVREIFARFTTDLEGLLDRVKSDNSNLEIRVQELQEQLGKEREARLSAAAKADEYRRDAQRMFAQEMAKTFDQKDWENVDPLRYSLTINDILAEVEKLPE